MKLKDALTYVSSKVQETKKLVTALTSPQKHPQEMVVHGKVGWAVGLLVVAGLFSCVAFDEVKNSVDQILFKPSPAAVAKAQPKLRPTTSFGESKTIAPTAILSGRFSQYSLPLFPAKVLHSYLEKNCALVVGCYHRAIDLTPLSLDQKVIAPTSGIVMEGWSPETDGQKDLGAAIQTEDGCLILFGHLINLSKQLIVGSRIQQGAEIGQVSPEYCNADNTVCASDSHVHFSVVCQIAGSKEKSDVDPGNKVPQLKGAKTGQILK